MRVAIYSTMTGAPWGGSEELWSRAAAELLTRGNQVFACVANHASVSSQLAYLAAMGARVSRRPHRIIGRKLTRWLAKRGIVLKPSQTWLKRARPDMLLISQAYHLDDISIAHGCHAMDIPYAILVQSASPYQWTHSCLFENQRAAYDHAAAVYFVSDQNRRIVETNYALDLSHAKVVDNPFVVDPNICLPWPSPQPKLSLACVARMDFTSKGQDLIIHVLRRPKWRERALQVSLYGSDAGNLRQIQELIKLHQLDNKILVRGFEFDVTKIWAEHHGLVLPSRFEGNSLALIESMICGRLAITTDTGRARELIDDNANGFIAAAATEDLLDEALERAWQRRDEWQAMGQAAAAAIRARHSVRPADDFADELLAAAKGHQNVTQPVVRAAA